MSKAQVYIVFEQAMNPELLFADKQAVWDESGLASGVLVNCETKAALDSTLDWLVGTGHYAEVRMLADEEEFPSRDERIKDVLATDA